MANEALPVENAGRVATASSANLNSCLVLRFPALASCTVAPNLLKQGKVCALSSVGRKQSCLRPREGLLSSASRSLLALLLRWAERQEWARPTPKYCLLERCLHFKELRTAHTVRVGRTQGREELDIGK